MSKIQGARIILRDLRREDTSILHRWLTDPEGARTISTRSCPQTGRETEHFVEAQISHDDPLNRAFMITLRDKNTPIGASGCYAIDWRNRCGELGIVIGEEQYRGHGYGTESLRLVLGFGFQTLDLHRLYVRVLDFNERAIGSFRKCGLVEEGRLRQAHHREGRYHDIVIMSILEEEYKIQSPVFRPRSSLTDRFRRFH